MAVDNKRALLVIDLQNGVGPLYGFDEVISIVNQRIAAFRAKGEPVIFIQHSSGALPKGSHEWEFVPSLAITAADTVIHKTQSNAFYHTTLKQVLNDLGVGSLELCGAKTEFCVDATIKAAFYDGYKVAVTKGSFSTTDNAILTAEKVNEFYWYLWSSLCANSPLPA